MQNRKISNNKKNNWYKIKIYNDKCFFGFIKGYWEILSYEYYDCDYAIGIPVKYKSDLVFKTKEEAKEYIKKTK